MKSPRSVFVLICLLIAQCTPQSLDTTGAIRCGTGGLCPTDFECRMGSCCPADAGLDCPAHALGSPCSANSDCTAPSQGGTAMCITDFDSMHFLNGYCSAQCDVNSLTDCGPNGTCVRLDASNNTTACLRSCTATAGTFTACAGTGSALSCYNTARGGVCVPDCTVGANTTECRDLGADEIYSCDARTHTCKLECFGTSHVQCPGGALMCDVTSNPPLCR